MLRGINNEGKNVEISSIYHNKKSIQVVYRYSKIIWEAIRSCFGNGLWKSQKPWIGKDAWKLN